MATGYTVQGDIVTTTLDGQPINDIWAEFNQTLDIVNTERSSITDLLTFRTSRSADAVAQAVSDEEFELATEFGIPVGTRAPSKHLVLGYPFYDYDKRTGFTWRFLRDATAEQIESVHNLALSADNKLTTTAILKRLLTPTPGINEDGRTVYGLYSNDGTVPPDYLFETFAGTHNHYMTSGSGAKVDSADIEDLYKTIAHHGYLDTAVSRAILFVAQAELDEITKFRAGITNNNTAVAKYDFIPSESAPPYLTAETIVGDTAPGNYAGLKIEGSYGPVWISKTHWLPSGYMVCVATGGPNSRFNPVGFREHANPNYRGLRLLPGNQGAYPLVDSFYSRAFGCGIRHRGAAAVMQITTGAYTVPVLP